MTVNEAMENSEVVIDSKNDTAKASRNRLASMVREIQKECDAANIPFVFAWYTKAGGYECKALLPQEMTGNGQLGDNKDDRFLELLRVAKGIKQDQYKSIMISES